MKIGVLTSSRADYGIYLPLLNKLKADSFFMGLLRGKRMEGGAQSNGQLAGHASGMVPQAKGSSFGIKREPLSQRPQTPAHH